MPHSRVRRIATATGVLATALLFAGGLATAPAWASGPIDSSEVQVSAAYGQTGYDSDATVSVTLTVTNNADDDLTGATAWAEGPCVGDPNPSWGWPSLGDIPAHSTQTFTISGAVPSPLTNGTATCSGSLSGGNLMGQLPFSASTTITQVYGDYQGLVYVDANGNGVADPGEGLAGVTATLNTQSWEATPTGVATTDSTGAFAFTHVPTGEYSLTFSTADNWVIGSPESLNYQDITITQAGGPTDVLAATRPLSDRLQVTQGFDKPKYQPGATLHFTVTLDNTGSTPITGVIADCDRVGNENDIMGGPAWGALDSGGAGATIPAGRKKTFNLTFPMPAGAENYGYVEAGCVYGPEPDGQAGQGYPGGVAETEVPGANAATFFQIMNADNTAPVPGVKFRLLDHETGKVVAQGLADSTGELRFTVPAGQYDILVPGWNLVYNSYFQAISPGYTDYPWTVNVTKAATGS